MSKETIAAIVAEMGDEGHIGDASFLEEAMAAVREAQRIYNETKEQTK